MITSDQRFRVPESEPRIGCNLCGSNGAVVRCEKCDSMAFCLSCDDMYHRHPKRRYHLRRAVHSLNKLMNGKQFQMSNGAENCGHPSKMPVPPPRRKKKGLTLSSIKDTFTSTGNILRRWVSNEKLTAPAVNANKYRGRDTSNGRPLEVPIIQKPMQTIRTTDNIQQNQTKIMKINTNFKSMPAPGFKCNNNSINISSYPKIALPLPPPPPPPRPRQPIYENYRKASLPSVNARTNGSVFNRVSSSIGNLSLEPKMNEMTTNSMNIKTFERKNFSLQDLRPDRSLDDNIPPIIHPHCCPHYIQNGPLFVSHPWATGSLNNSFENIQFNGSEDYDSDVSARDLSGIKRSRIKRCQSDAQMHQPIGQCPPVQTLCPHYYPHSYCFGPPLSPLPMRSLNMNSRSSVENMSTTSSSRNTSKKSKFNNKNGIKTKEFNAFNRKEQLSDSGARSVASSRLQSDSEDEENYFSVSDNSSSDNSAMGSEGDRWSCRFCTFLNENTNTICEICSKTNKKFKKNKIKIDRKDKKKMSINEGKSNLNEEFNERLVCEQKEIENELIRRLENERRFERENEKICRKEEYIRKRSLGLNVDPKLVEQIRRDEMSDQKDVNHNDIIAPKVSNIQSLIQSLNERKINCNSKENINYSQNEKQLRNEFSAQTSDEKGLRLTNGSNIWQNREFNDKSNENLNQTNKAINGYQTQFEYQMPSNITPNPMPPPMPSVNDYAERRPSYGHDMAFNANQNQFQNAFAFQSNPMISQNMSAMNPMMASLPPMPQTFTTNPLQNMYYSQAFHQQMNGQQTGLDRFGYRSNSISNDQNLMPQISSRYSSCENLQTISNNNNVKNEQKSQMESGLQLIQLLRDAEKKGFTADDIEVAINFSADKPLEWLDENWNDMCETVMTLANNQIMQNETKIGNKKLLEMDLLTENEAKTALRSSKGNIWQSIDKCVKSRDKETNGLNDKQKTSLTLNINGFGSGEDNNDMNPQTESLKQSIDNSIESQVIHKEDILVTNELNDHLIDARDERQMIEQLLTNWKNEKQLNEREINKLKHQERENEKFNKIIEFQRKMSQFESEDETDDENGVVLDKETIDEDFDRSVDIEIVEQLIEVHKKSEIPFIDENQNTNGLTLNDNKFDSELESLNSESSDGFDNIDVRIESQLNIESKNSHILTNNTSKRSEDINQLNSETKSNSLIKNQDSVDSNDCEEDNQRTDKNELKFKSDQQKCKIKNKILLHEIDKTVKQSLEDLEQIEYNFSENAEKQIMTSTVNEIKTENDRFDDGFGWARTQYECELCCGLYSMDDLVAMISCTHYSCGECLQKYYCLQIRERQRLVICCPFCDEPNIDPDDDDKVFEYLALLDQLIKHLVPKDVYELFERKVRDRALMRDPNFQWCSQCSSGFIAPNPMAKTLMCPDCKSLTCTSCKKKWKKQHLNITCQQFADWEKSNDPSYAEQQLDKHLKEFGIVCPKCKFQYQLAKGGCMHFRCIQCSYDFCGGCQRPFKMGNRCGISPFCEKLGLHSHHPRNCLFYLRDKDTEDMQSLLTKNQIQFKTKLERDQKIIRCPVMEQKETDSGFKDDPCGRYTENAGLCRLHYKEYLGDLIWRNGIDPIIVFSVDELEIVLKRENIRLPGRANSGDYKQRLIDLIVEKIPLKGGQN